MLFFRLCDSAMARLNRWQATIAEHRIRGVQIVLDPPLNRTIFLFAPPSRE
jgi:hypothetical protein